MTRNAPTSRIALLAAALVLAVVPPALADKGGKGDGSSAPSITTASATSKPSGGGGSNGGTATCGTTPRGSITNTWAWATPGSWGLPGQQLAYHVMLFNDDVSCGSSTYAISLAAPDGFAISIPQSTLTLSSGTIGYLWAYVTSPTGIPDGDYPLSLSVTRAGTTSPGGTATSYYKLYSSDSVPPTLYYASPWDGAAISGRSYNVSVASKDDHAVKTIELYIDGAYKSTSTCDDLTYECRLGYKWSLRGIRGTHTATFKSYDWLGNVGTQTTTFTVG